MKVSPPSQKIVKRGNAAIAFLFVLLFPPLIFAQDSTHIALAIRNHAHHGSHILFPGEKCDIIITSHSEENGILVTRGDEQGIRSIPVSKWMVSNLEGGNSRFGTIVEQAEGYAVYTAPSTGYYGPVTVSASVRMKNGSQETILINVYVIPRKLKYTYNVAVGCKCNGFIPHLMNSQGKSFTFEMNIDGELTASATKVEGPTPVLPEDGFKPKQGEMCDPHFVLSSVDFGSDLEMHDLQCTYNGEDNLLHFEIQAHNPDLPKYEVQELQTNKVVMTYPGAKEETSTWTPVASVSNLPYFSPETKAPGVAEGMIIRNKYAVEIAK